MPGFLLQRFVVLTLRQIPFSFTIIPAGCAPISNRCGMLHAAEPVDLLWMIFQLICLPENTTSFKNGYLLFTEIL